MAELASKRPSEILDVQGRNCPYPIILIKKHMEKLPEGSVLKILCDSSATAEDSIPRYCEKHGYPFEPVMIEENYWEVYIKKT